MLRLRTAGSRQSPSSRRLPFRLSPRPSASPSSHHPRRPRPTSCYTPLRPADGARAPLHPPQHHPVITRQRHDRPQRSLSKESAPGRTFAPRTFAPRTFAPSHLRTSHPRALPAPESPHASRPKLRESYATGTALSTPDPGKPRALGLGLHHTPRCARLRGPSRFVAAKARRTNARA